MKLIGVALSLLIPIVCAPQLAAQQSETESKTKIQVKDGKDVKVTGCVAKSGSSYMLTNVADKKGALHSYTLVSAENELAKHVGHRVELSGTATDRGDGKVSIETKTTTKVEGGSDSTSKNKAEFEGDLAGMSYIGVKSVKMIAAVCP